MTRDEAIQKVSCVRKDKSLELFYVDVLVTLGVLKLEEPESAGKRFGKIIRAYVDGYEAGAIVTELDEAGLKIVEK